MMIKEIIKKLEEERALQRFGDSEAATDMLNLAIELVKNAANKNITAKLTETVCDKYCKYPDTCVNQEELDGYCDDCDLVRLWNDAMSLYGDSKITNLDRFKDIDYVAKLINEYCCCDDVCLHSPFNDKKGNCKYEDNITEENCIECTKIWLMQECKSDTGKINDDDRFWITPQGYAAMEN
jgi:hypothetical protein